MSQALSFLLLKVIILIIFGRSDSGEEAQKTYLLGQPLLEGIEVPANPAEDANHWWQARVFARSMCTPWWCHGGVGRQNHAELMPHNQSQPGLVMIPVGAGESPIALFGQAEL